MPQVNPTEAAQLRLSQDCMSLAQDTLVEILGKAQPMPDRLFHYTNEQGLLGIIEKGEVWATHQEFMNDPSETSHARMISQEVVRSEFPSDEASQSIFLHRAGNGSSVWHGEFHADAYIASFSAAPDSLSQWRAYANNGKGYCIEIDPTRTPHGQRFDSFESGTAFFRVAYGEDTLRRGLRGFQTRGSSLINDATEAGVERTTALNLLGNWFQVVVQLSQRVCKQDGYEEEREWRLVHIRRRQTFPYDVPDTEGIKYRASRGQVVPYVPISLLQSDSLPVRSIWLGPAGVETERELALKMLLRSNTLTKDASILRSRTLYRG